jgi:hypothetical protein
VSDDEPLIWIRIEADFEDDGRLGWVWEAFGEKKYLCCGASYSLSECLDLIRESLDEWMSKAHATSDA